MLVREPEHPLHVGERLLDLAVQNAQEVERNVELDHERVDQHEIANGHRLVDHADRRAPHDQRHGDRDDRALRHVQERQRRLAADGRPLPALQAFVVAARFPVLVAEILDGLVVEQAVDRARVRLRVELVHLAAERRAPVGDRDGRDHVERERGERDRDEDPVVARDQDRRDERDFEHRGQDRIQRIADQGGDAALAAFDVAREPTRLPGQVKAQRQRVQVPEDLERDRPDCTLRDFREQKLAELGEERRRETQRAVGDQQRQRDGQDRERGIEAVDDPLEQERDADVGDLGPDQRDQRREHPALVRPEVGKQRTDGVPVTALRGARKCARSSERMPHAANFSSQLSSSARSGSGGRVGPPRNHSLPP